MARNVVYPLYRLGGPQLRVFRTNFFIQLVRPGVAQPEDTVQFRIPMEMTRVDLRNYLEGIYNVPVAAVRTRVQHGSNKRRDHRNVRIKKPDYKVAYVQLVPHPRSLPLCLQHRSQLRTPRIPCIVAFASWGPGSKHDACSALCVVARAWAAVYVSARLISVAG
ncbi:mitochondrial ribosomal protein L23 [Homo sapiens]|uniref:Large ribosomal subunit protein uL23m n=1 Tax=Homo sapiens TaxID=9606 RepID=A6NJD9_HUMAN|nr:large ribosomal subunit protein uL23m isoform 6 [Homo sapiens]KAI2558094.1 mitochondrial ribosomal protein L23 [Homo sapiens]KAI4069435.1 mitochondrial ribosomal protein L23 [Homo sapiens]